MALPQQLLALQNPQAIRQAILSRLNINPARVQGFNNAGFDEDLNNLYRQGLQTATQLDSAAGNIGRQYNQDFSQAGVDRERALKQIRENFANRGMSFSGAQIDELSNANSDFDRFVANLTANRDAGLTDIGKQRTNLLESLTRGRQTAEQSYGQDVGAFLHQQAVELWNNTIAQNMLRAAASRPRSSSGGGGGSSGSRPRTSSRGSGVRSSPRPTYPAPPPPTVSSAPRQYSGQYAIPNMAINRPKPKTPRGFNTSGFPV